MLKLERRVGETIVITSPCGSLIRIKLGQVKASRDGCGRAWMLFDAPREFRVDRLEVHEEREANAALPDEHVLKQAPRAGRVA